MLRLRLNCISMYAWHSGLIYAYDPTVLGSYQYHNLNVLTSQFLYHSTYRQCTFKLVILSFAPRSNVKVVLSNSSRENRIEEGRIQTRDISVLNRGN